MVRYLSFFPWSSFFSPTLPATHFRSLQGCSAGAFRCSAGAALAERENLAAAAGADAAEGLSPGCCPTFGRYFFLVGLQSFYSFSLLFCGGFSSVSQQGSQQGSQQAKRVTKIPRVYFFSSEMLSGVYAGIIFHQIHGSKILHVTAGENWPKWPKRT